MLSAALLSKVHVRSWGTAIVAAILIGIFDFIIGWLLKLILNVATLGIPYLLGLSFIINWIVFAIVLKIVDGLMKGLKIDGFGTALIMAAIVSICGLIAKAIFGVG
jgi:putative membrane protein